MKNFFFLTILLEYSRVFVVRVDRNTIRHELCDDYVFIIRIIMGL